MEWWRILFIIAVVAFISYSVYSFFTVGFTKNVLLQGIALLSVALLIYTKK